MNETLEDISKVIKEIDDFFTKRKGEGIRKEVWKHILKRDKNFFSYSDLENHPLIIYKKGLYNQLESHQIAAVDKFLSCLSDYYRHGYEEAIIENNPVELENYIYFKEKCSLFYQLLNHIVQ